MNTFLDMDVSFTLVALVQSRCTDWSRNPPDFEALLVITRFVASIQSIDERHDGILLIVNFDSDPEYEGMTKPQATFNGQYGFDSDAILIEASKEQIARTRFLFWVRARYCAARGRY